MLQLAVEATVNSSAIAAIALKTGTILKAKMNQREYLYMTSNLIIALQNARIFTVQIFLVAFSTSTKYLKKLQKQSCYAN